MKTVQEYNDSLNESKKHQYSTKEDAIGAFFKGDITSKELEKIAKQSFKSEIATKKELNMFLTNKFMQDIMSDQQGISVDVLKKKVKELLPLVESDELSQLEEAYKDVSIGVTISKDEMKKLHKGEKVVYKEETNEGPISIHVKAE